MMTSNNNSNPRLRKKVYKSQVVENYPTGNVNVVNYDSDASWQDNNTITPRIGDIQRMDTLSVRSNNQNYGVTNSKDEFEIYGSFVRQRSEKKSSNTSSEKSRTVLQPSLTFKNLPVKDKNVDILFPTDSDKILSRSVSVEQSQPAYSAQTAAYPDSPFDLVQRFDTYTESSYSTLPKVRVSSEARERMLQESTVPQRFLQSFTSATEASVQDDSTNKDLEISRLNRTVSRITKKLSLLTDNNHKLQEHINNLLGERKQLLRQIDNSEFEEIIEEEEVKQARPNMLGRENVAQLTYVYDQTPQFAEVSHTNCLQRSKITLDDVPQILLESFRIDIQNYEKEKSDMEKRSLVDALKLQQQKQLQLLQEEVQAKKVVVQHVSVQSYQRTKFNQKLSETNFRRTPSPKSTSSSVGVNASPILKTTQSQTDGNHSKASLHKFTAATDLSVSQKSVIEKAIASLESGNYEELIMIFQNAICRPSVSVGVGSSLVCSVKSTNTARVDSVTVELNVDTIRKVVQPKIFQENRAVMVKPTTVQRSCQHEDTFSFESGTMTDQSLCRSQGVMTVVEYPDHLSSASSEVDSVVKRTGHRSESQRITISETTHSISPMKEFVRIQERSVEPSATVEEHFIDIRKVNSQKPLRVSEEIQQTIEERVQQVTSVLDQNMIPKQEVPTTIACWETVTLLKDGEVVDKKQTFHNSTVSTDNADKNDSSSKGNSSKYTDDENIRVQRSFYSEGKKQIGCEEIKVEEQNRTSPRNEASYQGLEQSFRYGNVKKPVEVREIKVHQTSNILPSYREQEHSSTEIVDCNSKSESLAADMQRHSSSVSVLTTPVSFHSFDVSQGRSNFSSSRTESHSFQSEIKSVESNQNFHPVQIKRGASTETFSGRIPISTSSESSQSNSTRIPITIVNNRNGAHSLSSSNSAFHSLSLSKGANSPLNIAVTVSNIQSEDSKIFLSEIIFQNCRQLYLWVKTVHLITSSTVYFLPAPLITVSSSLLEWWFGMIEKNDSVLLAKIVKYLIYTFSKNFLKYFVITVDRQGTSCLHYIVSHQMWDCYDVLDSHNLVDSNVYNGQGFTVLMVACKIKIVTDSGRDHLRKLASTANVNLTSKYEGQTALLIAAQHGHSLTVQMLYSLGADINIRDQEYNTPLMVACSKNSIDVVTTILSWSGVLVDLRNKEGKTALDIASEGRFTDLLEIFRQRNTTKASEISSYSRMVQNRYSSNLFGPGQL